MFIELYDYFLETAKQEGHTIEESHSIALNKTKGDNNNVQNYQDTHYEDLDRIRSAAQNRQAALAY